MANSFVTTFIGNLYQQDVVFGNEKIVFADDEDGKLLPVSLLRDYIEDSILKLLTYKAGDVVSIPSNTMMAGVVSGSSKTITFNIPLDKAVSATSLTFECNDLTARGTSGYLITDVPVSNYTVSHKISKNFVTIIVTSATAFNNATNNTPVIVEGTMKITFK